MTRRELVDEDGMPTCVTDGHAICNGYAFQERIEELQTRLAELCETCTEVANIIEATRTESGAFTGCVKMLRGAATLDKQEAQSDE